MGYWSAGVKGLHMPMMAVIDYRGFRLVAMAYLPIRTLGTRTRTKNPS
jgi:hypothetical protein